MDQVDVVICFPLRKCQLKYTYELNIKNNCCFVLFKEYISGDEDNLVGTRSRRHSSPGESRTGSTTALQQQDYSDSVSFVLKLFWNIIYKHRV